jgi:hypothetical protein
MIIKIEDVVQIVKDVLVEEYVEQEDYESAAELIEIIDNL